MADTSLRAVASLSNITPPLGAALCGSFQPRCATDVEDDLHARALVVDKGERRLALVVCDLICMPRAGLDQAKALIARRCGIPPAAVLISCTHTHSGEVFCRFGLDIKAAPAFDTTMVIELANDYTGYIPTAEAFEDGGDETWRARSSKLDPAAGSRMAETATRVLSGLHAA